ncbi:MAG: 16S rRNA (cytidine(1402)-2'-O)-methyltransferase [Eudoraea sp.]|nr:16S rRNA (cytidine(1402)-2'-O)-methyltransferase [Eudoraea sp.]NNK30345.1 16S rRNA (cytidine(1402)-2'-O)-methyltransferase [Flavobacteriaceae bacterium]
MLYIVPTPIGNLEDITQRGLKTLQEVDLILAEDTRTSKNLLQHFGIDTPLKSHHMHNEHKQVPHLVDQMLSGTKMALITDAGTPGISDPGFLLTRACIEAGIVVSCLPGPTAFVPALVMSGLPCDRFVFEGFLPPKKGRQTRMSQLAEEERTMVFYESPHRVVKTLSQMALHFGEDRAISISREISKKFEETIRGSIKEVRTHFETHTVKGELVLVVQGKK